MEQCRVRGGSAIAALAEEERKGETNGSRSTIYRLVWCPQYLSRGTAKKKKNGSINLVLWAFLTRWIARVCFASY